MSKSRILSDLRAPKLHVALGWHILCLTLGAAFFATGCSSKQCLFQSDCAEGLICVESICRQACDEMRQCPVDFVCVEEACMPDESVNCPDGDICNIDMTVEMRMDQSIMNDESEMGMLPSDDAFLSASDAMMSMDFDLPPDMAVADAALALTIDQGRMQDSRFDLSGPYNVIHDYESGDTPEPDRPEDMVEGEGTLRNKVELTAISNNRYRIKVFDRDGNMSLFEEPNVDFTDPRGVGFFTFDYPWNQELEGEECWKVQIRSQRGSYTQTPQGYRLVGNERRVTCSCAAEAVNPGRNVELRREDCLGAYTVTNFNVRWIPW